MTRNEISLVVGEAAREEGVNLGRGRGGRYRSAR